MANPRQALGRWGEALAADFLQTQGYTIIERNARTPYGEIDLVAVAHLPARDGTPEPVTVFVEVKTRASASLGPPEISVGRRKQAHLVAAAQAYLQQHPHLAGNWRIDVVSIQRQPASRLPEIRHFENAVS
jgi:putative endonuclease